MRAAVFAIVALAAAGVAFTQNVPCSDVAGSFNDGSSVHLSTYSCTQSVPGNFSCTVSLWNPGPSAYCHMTYTGAGYDYSNGSNHNKYTATYDSGTCPPHIFPYSGWLALTNSCTQMSDTMGLLIGPSSVQRQGNFLGCEVPGTNGNGGENPSVPDGWDTPTQAAFTATLKDTSDSNYNFLGRTTQEVNTAGPNGCLVAASIDGGSTWTPDLNHNYSVGWDDGYPGFAAPDTTGIDPEWIDTVRQLWKPLLPCTAVFHQQMMIDCPPSVGQLAYEYHDQDIIVDDKTVTFTRHAASQTHVWGTSRDAYHWWAIPQTLLRPPFLPHP